MKPNDFISVATCTLGDSASRLQTLLYELRAFTDIPFRQVVCDDGTLDLVDRNRQQWVCEAFGADWVECPGEPWGISYAWNHCLEQVRTPWAFCVEDGLRPGWGWLETALDFIDKVGSRRWQGHQVGMAGCSHIQDWNLAMAGVWPGKDVMQVFRGDSERWGEPWNDGLWCWPRVLPVIELSCRGDTSAWTNDVEQFRQLVVGEALGSPDDRPLHPSDVEQAWLKWNVRNRWPRRRTACCGWYPGAFMIVNMEAWRKVGRFRDGCTFFEGHLGTRMGVAGYLSLCLEFPPWLHCPSLGFKAYDVGRRPRDHRDTATVFREDFQGFDNMDAPNVLANAVVPLDVQRSVNEDLAAVELYARPEWREWL